MRRREVLVRWESADGAAGELGDGEGSRGTRRGLWNGGANSAKGRGPLGRTVGGEEIPGSEENSHSEGRRDVEGSFKSRV